MADKKATLTFDGKAYDLPVLSPTLGPDVVDIRKLYAEADIFTFDPGFTSTACPAGPQTGPERPASKPWAWIFPRALASRS